MRTLALPASAPLHHAALRSARWGIAAVLLAVLIAVRAHSALAAPPPSPPADSKAFLDGFRAYQQGDYAGSQLKLGEVVARFPSSPVRDMALYWLSRACYRSGNQRDAAGYLSQLFREYPGSPLKALVNMEMMRLVTRYEHGEPLPTAAGTAVDSAAKSAV